MKKYSKLMAVLLVVAMLLPGIAQAAPVAGSTNVFRLAGQGRVETSVEASKEIYTNGSATNVVLAGYNGEVDALTGTLLAGAKNAPLILTNKDVVPNVVLAELTRLGAKNVYILGGEMVVSKAVVTQLEALNYTVKRVAGDTREETALEVAKEVKGKTTHVFLAKGYDILADALAAGPVSALKDMPVLLTQTNKLPQVTIDAMVELGVTNVTILGQTGAVSQAVEDQLKKTYTVDRIGAADREKTAVAIADKYFTAPKNAVVANGYVYADALVGGYVGAKINGPILLTNVNSATAATTDYMMANTDKAWILGGPAAVSQAVEDKVVATVDFNEELKVVSVSAINGTKLEIKFSKAVDKNTISNADFRITAIDMGGSTPTLSAGVLSDDGKIYTIETDGAAAFDGRYDVDVTAKAFKSTDGKDVAKYSTTISVDDKTAPAISKATFKNNANDEVTITVEFDEQLSALGTVSVDGKVISASLNADNKTFDIVALEAGKTYKVDIVGATDVAGNIANPLTTTVKTTTDTVAPTGTVKVSGVEITVDFSEEVNAGFTVKVNGGSALPAVQDANDKTVYTIDATSALSGAKFLNNAEIVVSNIYDLAGNQGKDIKHTANLLADTTAPKFVSAEVDGVNLVLKFDEKLDDTTAALITEANLDIEYVDKDGVLHVLAPTTDFTATSTFGYDLNGNLSIDANTEEEKYVTITLAEAVSGTDFIDAGKLLKGTYSVILAKDALEDEAGNKTVEIKFKVVATAETSATDTVTYSAATHTKNNQFKVTYDEAMGASALVASNYTLGGKALPNGTTLVFLGDQENVLVTLPEGYITVTGARVVVANNVTAKSGNTIDVDAQKATPATVILKENVAPTAKTVKIVSDTVVNVEFSEELASVAPTGVTVKINNVKTTTAPTIDSDGVLVLTFTDAGTLKSTDKVTVEFKDSNLADADGNLVKDATIAN